MEQFTSKIQELFLLLISVYNIVSLYSSICAYFNCFKRFLAKVLQLYKEPHSSLLKAGKYF